MEIMCIIGSRKLCRAFTKFVRFSVFFFFFFFFLSTERIDESYIKVLTATSNGRLTTSENAWVLFWR